jgi:hypothetical protein
LRGVFMTIMIMMIALHGTRTDGDRDKGAGPEGPAVLIHTPHFVLVLLAICQAFRDLRDHL